MARQPLFNTTGEEYPPAIPWETERMVLSPYCGTSKILGTGNVASVYAVENAVTLNGASIAVKVRRTLEGRHIKEDIRTASFNNEMDKTSYLRRTLIEAVKRVLVGDKILTKIDKEHSTPEEKLIFKWIELPYSPTNQNLQKWLYETEKSSISLKDFLDIFEQVLFAAQDCHSAGVTHGDIGLDNALIDVHKQKISLIDLGLSRFIAKEPALNWFVTEDQNSPFTPWGLGDRFGPALHDRRVVQPYNDVYSLGLFFLEMLMTYLFQVSGREALSLEILEHKKCPLELLDLIKSMRNEKPEKRPSIATCIATVQRIKASTRILLRPEK